MRRAAALLAVALSSAGAFGESSTFQIGDPSQMARPSRIVPPEFPKSALEKRLSATVDIEGRVSPLRALEDVTFSWEPAGSEAFVDAVKQVLPYWEFYPVLGDESCFPSDRRITNRVSFEWVGGEPKVFVTVRPAPDPLPAREQIRALERTEPQYPRSAINARQQAYVYAEVTILADGSVSGVKARVFPQITGRAAAWFEREVVGALSRWKFTPGEKATRRGCYDILFKIRD